MALTLAMAVTQVGPTSAGRPINCTVTVTNGSGGTLSISDLRVNATSQLGTTVSQPVWLTPNVAPGDGNPSMLNNAVNVYPFQVMVPSPNTPGAASTAPNALRDTDIPTNSIETLQATVLMSDGTSASTTLTINLLSAVRSDFPPAAGTLAFSDTTTAVNWFFFA